MAGAFFSFLNKFDTATVTDQLGNISPSLPITNLKDRRLALKARTTTKFFTIRVDFGIQKKIDVIGILSTNSKKTTYDQQTLDLNSISVKASNVSPGGTDVLNPISSTIFTDNPPQWMPRNFFWPINISGVVGKTARYWEISVTIDTTDSYYEIGRIWMGEAIQWEAVDAEWSLTIKDASTLIRSRGQQVYADVKQKYRKLNISVSSVSQKWMFGDVNNNPTNLDFQNMFFTSGITGEVLVLPRTGDDTTQSRQFMSRTGIYGVIAEEQTIRKIPGDNYSVDLSIEECL